MKENLAISIVESMIQEFFFKKKTNKNCPNFNKLKMIFQRKAAPQKKFR
jgi:hypothetical protein